MERGREQPPDSSACPVPRPARRVAHAPVPVSQTAIKTASDLRADCECVVRCVLVQIAHGMYRTFDADFDLRTRLCRPSHDQRRAVLGVVKALAALDPAGFGLDDACAPL